MGYSYSFIPLLSNEELTLFDSYYRDLQTLESNSLIMSTVDILTKLRTMLPHPSYWREFIGKGLHCYVNHGQANCFINLDSLYDTFEDKFSNELHRLSVTSLIYLSHPVMPKNRQLHLLSMAKDINSQDGTMLDPNQLTFEDFERIIIIYLKAILLDRGILFEDEFSNVF